MSPTSALLADLAATSQFCTAAERLLMTRCRIAIEVHRVEPNDVAAAIGMSRATMYRRMRRTGVRMSEGYSQE